MDFKVLSTTQVTSGRRKRESFGEGGEGGRKSWRRKKRGGSCVRVSCVGGGGGGRIGRRGGARRGRGRFHSAHHKTSCFEMNLFSLSPFLCTQKLDPCLADRTDLWYMAARCIQFVHCCALSRSTCSCITSFAE